MVKMSNLQVDKKNNMVRLTVDTRFYGASAVMMAGKEYTDSCWVFIDGDVNDKLLVTLKSKDKSIDVNTLGYEFYNYMLSLIQDASS